jgi:hypothetical protein
VEGFLTALLSLTNETLAAAIVVVAASLLLYNLTRNLHDRVTRGASTLLACVTFAYIVDVFVSLEPSRQAYDMALRIQWLGIAFMPAAMFHLSDALLATTGLPSRGRRKRIGRMLYGVSTLFLLLALFTNLLVRSESYGPFVSLRAGPLFPVYSAYFVVAVLVAFYNTQRARQRCLTRNTRRRMGYLQFAMLTPAIGIFPFSVLISPGQEFSLPGLALVNIANIVVILMLLFLAYPLSFFGSRVPDRVVKVELLRFLMRGPATGMLALATIVFITPATRVLGMPGQTFLPFAVVAVVLLWQWVTALSLPYLEKRLVYPDDDDQLDRLQNLSERLLTRTDLLQLLEANLSAACDYLRVNTAFVASLTEADAEIVSSVGPTRPTTSLLLDERDILRGLAAEGDEVVIHKWQSYWVAPLYSTRASDNSEASLIGVMGIQARAAEIDLLPDEWQMLRLYVRRAEQTLDDMRLQGEIVAALEGLLPQINLTRSTAAEVEYKPGRQPAPAIEAPPIDREQFTEQVKAALKHYWGGPGLTSSRLLDLSIVRAALDDNEQNPARALRTVLTRAIENQRPEGERKMVSPEWTLYNILELRFIKKAKVREVAPRIALSEPDLYRKQNLAIQNLADTLLRMEQEYVSAHPEAADFEPVLSEDHTHMSLANDGNSGRHTEHQSS